MIHFCNTLPVITLYQPWATWIMRGWKTIETRTHTRFSSLKGKKILIHSGMTTDGSDLTAANPYLSREQLLHRPNEFINGYILGSCLVTDFKKLNASHSKDALIDCGITVRWGLLLSEIMVFETAIPAKGEIGIWYFDLTIREKVKKNG